MKSFAILILIGVVLNISGCYTVVYQSDDTQIFYSEPDHIPVPMLVPQPILLFPTQPNQPIYTNPPSEKIRPGNDARITPGDSYKKRDPIRNQGGRGNEERLTQGR